jgi:hypothetical protein
VITVFLVHETSAPTRRVLVGVCDDHTNRLKRATWVQIDELIGFSSVLECEACALMADAGYSGLLPVPNANLRLVSG